MRLALIQMAMGQQREDNLQRAESLVRQAAARGAGLVLLPELFAGPYFPQSQRQECFAEAVPVQGSWVGRFQALARELSVVLPISFFERCGQAYFNSLALFEADGALLGLYRKTHLPDGPGYQEKYYFNPGDTPLEPFPTSQGPLGLGICWDQWFPEVARCLVLQGAELLLYPTAIGSEPPEAGSLDTQAMWRRAMQGHAVCNACYLGAANRVGREGEARFYGRSFVCDYTGEVLAEAGEEEEAVLLAELDLPRAQAFRAGMGFFRDRRPDLYSPLLRLGG